MTFDYKDYWNNRLQGDFGLESVGYIGMGLSYNLWMYKLRKSIFLRYAAKFQKGWENKSVLDIGSGAGFYVDLWKKLGVEKLMGVDISTQAVSNLKKKHEQFSFEKLDIATDLLTSNAYDAVSCMDVLFHVVDDNKFIFSLRNINQSLKKGGIFIFSDNFLHKEEKRVSHHVSRTLAYYENALKDTGFRVLMRKPMFYFMNEPVDSEGYLINYFWNQLRRIVKDRNTIGYIAGLCLYPVDRILTFWASEGPSTELMICEKNE